jgi:signal transduction histidine kinase
MKSRALASVATDPGTTGSQRVGWRPLLEHSFFRYGLAVLSVAAALGIKLTLQKFNVGYPLSSSFLAAIAISFWYGGTGPGLVSVVLSFVAFGYFVLPYEVAYRMVLPDGSTKPVYLSASWRSHLPYFIYFAVVALLMSWFSSSRRRAERLLSQARSELELKVEERTTELQQVNEELRAEITERKRAEEALRASEQVARGQVEALAQSLDVLATAPAPDKFLGQMLSTIGRLLNAQSVILWLLDDANDSLVVRAAAEGANFAATDPEHPYIKNASSWKEDKVLQETVFTGAPVVCEDIEHDPRVSNDIRDYFRSKGTKKYMTIPTLVGGHVKGFIGIRHGARPLYQPEEIELAQALAHQAMLAIQLNLFAEQSQQAAVLEERNRMARDIHDTLAQGFTGVIIQLEAAEDATSCGQQAEADKHLHRAAGLARQSLSEARRSVHALRPDALERDNFWDALKGIIKNTTAGTALHATFELRGKLPELPRIWQENLLHIGQEALTNTLKYADAKNFRARLTCNGKGVRLELRDDGAGFELKDRNDGLGLTGMRERVEQMSGELEITSERGKGTNIVVALPLNQGSIS